MKRAGKGTIGLFFFGKGLSYDQVTYTMEEYRLIFFFCWGSCFFWDFRFFCCCCFIFWGSCFLCWDFRFFCCCCFICWGSCFLCWDFRFFCFTGFVAMCVLVSSEYRRVWILFPVFPENGGGPGIVADDTSSSPFMK